MEDFARRISIQTEGTNNVLVIKLQQGETLIPYCCKVMERNNIPGLLRMRHQMMDGVVRLRYNIGGKVPLREFMLRHHLTYKNGVLLLRNLCDALLHLNEYFLTVDMCYLDPEQIYVGDGLTVYLPCVPVAREQSRSSAACLKQFFEKLLSEYFATADCNSYDDMFKWVYKATLFDLETFYIKFLKEDPQERPETPAPAPVPAPAKRAPAPRPETPAAAAGEEENSHELTELLEEKMRGLKSIYPGVAEEKDKEKMSFPKPRFGKPETEKAAPAAPEKSETPGFAIPGAPSFAVPGSAPGAEARKKGKPEKEKKSFWPFGAKTEKEEEAEPVPPVKTAPRAPASKPAAPKPAPAKKAAPAPAEDSWEEGTILVDGPGAAPVPPANTPRTAGEAYLVHNNQKVPIKQTPFLIGKYNTTIKLHYAIYDNNKVSRSHATILQEKGQYFVRDNQSRNGTFLNGKPILPLQPVALKDGDEIKLYDEVLVFHLEGAV